MKTRASKWSFFGDQTFESDLQIWNERDRVQAYLTVIKPLLLGHFKRKQQGQKIPKLKSQKNGLTIVTVSNFSSPISFSLWVWLLSIADNNQIDWYWLYRVLISGSIQLLRLAELVIMTCYTTTTCATWVTTTTWVTWVYNLSENCNATHRVYITIDSYSPFATYWEKYVGLNNNSHEDCSIKYFLH